MDADNRPTLLLVDDTEINIDVLVELLAEDYELRVALDGAEALELVAEEPPDLILLDIMMPGMSGYEVCERLKGDPKTRAIPVIFVTAMSDIEDEAQGLALGAVDYITKPISPAIVKARVRNHLALRAAFLKLERQNEELLAAAQLKEDVERITRHDLKTPLNAIVGFPQLLLMDDNLTPDQRESIALIEESGRKMLQMINLSLDLFKMERGLYTVAAARVDLARLLRKLCRETSEHARSKRLRVGLEIGGEDAAPDATFFALGEELLCYSMLANLLKNAIEASPPGERVRLCLDRDGATARIAITNRGTVPEEIRATFFDKYSTSRKGGGTGLGTYSARLIAETQDGAISFVTSEREGTTVTVQLPAPGA